MSDIPVSAVERRYDDGALRAAILVMIIWHVMPVLPSSVFLWSFDRVPLTYGAATWVLDAVLGAVAATVVLRGGGHGPWLGLLIVPTLLLGVLATALSSPSFYHPYNWAFTSVGWFALVALWRRPLPEFLAFVAGNTLVGLIALAALGEFTAVPLARYLVYAHGVCVIQVTLLIGGRLLARIAGRTAQDQDRLTRVVTQRLIAETVQAARRRRYDLVRPVVAGHLAELAAGRLDVTRPETGQLVSVAISRLRRLMVESEDLPDPLLRDLRSGADAAEHRGAAVDLQAAVGTIPPMPPAVRLALTEPVLVTLAATRTRARITVVARPAEVAVAILADAPLPELAHGAHPSVRCDHDLQGDQLWVQTRWIIPSHSRS
ncbi:hypothetical protein [Nonomuraea typhae]|uniref:hypothetical protein n=1 Tax=Nonomuraea typhae TaxID=2603600 RepID=UPI0012F7C06B|nr:hypothetical protein [Nonomuraea typhae]